jgi:hypothetical protein
MVNGIQVHSLDRPSDIALHYKLAHLSDKLEKGVKIPLHPC